MVNKQKANNPLVPDQLIEYMTKVGMAADNARVRTLTALQSCYVAEAALLESNKVLALGANQCQTLTNNNIVTKQLSHVQSQLDDASF
jgi:hypothetical protein